MATVRENELVQREVDELLAATGRAVHLVPDRRTLQRRRELYYRRAERRGMIPRDVPVQMMGGWVRRLQRRLGIWVRRLDGWQQRAVLRACLREVTPGQSSDLRDIWEQRGMVSSLYDFAAVTRGHGMEAGDLPASAPEELRRALRVYQRRLIGEEAADKPGLFLRIIRALREDDSLHFQRIVVDGFCDLPPSELRLVRAAGERAEAVRILVPHDGRVADVYPTDDQLRRNWGALADCVVRCIPDELADAPLSGRLFRLDPTELSAAPPEYPRIRLWTVGNEREQSERIAAHLKERLRRGHEPGECCVVVRREQHRAVLTRHLLRAGIPLSDHTDIPLGETRTGRLIGVTLDAIESPSVAAIHRLVSSPLVNSEWTELRRLPAYASAESEGAAIRCRLRVAKQSLRYRGEDEEFRTMSPEQSSAVAGEIGRLCRLLDSLLNLLSQSDVSDPYAGHRRLMSILDGLGVQERLRELLADDAGGTAEVIADLSAWQKFRAQAERGLDSALLPRMPREALRWSDFAEIIREYLRGVVVPLPGVPDATELRPREGRGVQLLAGEPPHPGDYAVVVLPYMTSGIFPRHTAAGWLEDAYLGDELADPAAEERAENRFFYRCACAARDDLLLTFPREVEETPQVPSPYLQEMEMAASVRPSDLTSSGGHRDGGKVGRIASWRRLRMHLLAAGALGSGGDHLLQRSLVADGLSGDELGRAVRSSRARAGREWTEWDGVLSAADAVRALRRIFPTDAEISPTYLERYASCPFRFFLAEVLGLSERFRIEREVPVFLVGRLYHGVLEAYYRGHMEHIALGRGPDREQERREVQRLTRQRTERLRRAFAWLDDHVFASLARRTEEVLCRFLAHERERRQGGAGEAGELFPWQVERPFALGVSGRSPGGEDYSLQVRGVIDRVDRTEAPAAEERDIAVVFDYKMTANPPRPKDMLCGGDLQIPLYIAAARQLLPDLRVLGGGYLSINGCSARSGLYHPEAAAALQLDDERHAVTPTELSRALDTCRDVLLRHWEHIRSGIFPVRPKDDNACRWCEFSSVCRHEPRRIRRKTRERSPQNER